MMNWWRYDALPRIRDRRERLQCWMAFRMPRWLAYWCTVRVAVNASTGTYSNQNVPALTCADALKRWGNP